MNSKQGLKPEAVTGSSIQVTVSLTTGQMLPLKDLENSSLWIIMYDRVTHCLVSSTAQNFLQ